jgi:hypothetical protein
MRHAVGAHPASLFLVALERGGGGQQRTAFTLLQAQVAAPPAGAGLEAEARLSALVGFARFALDLEV